MVDAPPVQCRGLHPPPPPQRSQQLGTLLPCRAPAAALRCWRAGTEHKEVFMSRPWAVHRGSFVRGAPARRGRRLPPSPAIPSSPHHLLHPVEDGCRGCRAWHRFYLCHPSPSLWQRVVGRSSHSGVKPAGTCPARLSTPLHSPSYLRVWHLPKGLGTSQTPWLCAAGHCVRGRARTSFLQLFLFCQRLQGTRSQTCMLAGCGGGDKERRAGTGGHAAWSPCNAHLLL